MAEQTVNAASNAASVNSTVDKILAEPEKVVAKAEITAPSDNVVNLPAGYLSPSGEVIRTAEVRELNGRDEEQIVKGNNLLKQLNTILSRAVTKLGNEPVDDNVLDRLFIGDRDELLLGIYKATFGPTAELAAYCAGCEDLKTVEVNVDRDIERRILVDPLEDRRWTVNTSGHEYLVTLPTGVAQKELTSNPDKTTAELTTTLLENCILEIDGSPMLGKAQVQAIGIKDRRKLGEEIAKRVPGPKFETAEVTCPDCGGKVGVPINLGTLFRF
jgi:hypothetical protein